MGVKKQTLSSLDAWRGIFILFIIYHHCYFIPNCYENGFGRTGVVFFFILSGFVLAYRYRESLQDNSFSTAQFFKKRVARIFPLHLLMALLTVFFGGIVIDNVFWKALPLNIALLQSWIPLWRVYYSVNGVSWFLSALLFCYFIFSFVMNLFIYDKKIAYLLFICFCAIVVVAQLYWPDINQGWMNKIGIFSHNPLICSRFFVLGIITEDVFNRIIIKHSDISSKILVLAELVIVYSICLLLSNYGIIKYDGGALLLASLILAFAIDESRTCPSILCKILQCRPLLVLGRISFSAYLIHDLIIHFVAKLPGGCIPLQLALVYGVSLSLAYLSKRYFEPW